MKVIIEFPIDLEALVPVPTDEVQIVNHALGGFISWPKSLIDFSDAEESNGTYQGGPTRRQKEANDMKRKMPQGSNISSQSTKGLPKSCKRAYIYTRLMPSDTLITIPMDASRMGLKYDLHISKEDILQLVNMASLNTSCMELYIRFLVGLCEELHAGNMFGFVSPSFMSASNPISTRTAYLSKRLKKNPKTCYFVPYIDHLSQVAHSMLCVIYPKDNLVYWLDSMHKELLKDIKDTINSALFDYQWRGTSRSRPKSQWKKVICPMQVGGTEYGYYVMMYMKDIILDIMDGHPRTIEQCFQSTNCFTQESIDQLHEQWASYLLDCVDEFGDFQTRNETQS